MGRGWSDSSVGALSLLTPTSTPAQGGHPMLQQTSQNPASITPAAATPSLPSRTPRTEAGGAGWMAAMIPAPGGAQQPPGSPASSAAPSPWHRQETTASACRQADNGHQPHPAWGGGTQPSCPRAQSTEEVHPCHAHGSPMGPLLPCTELGVLTGRASGAACPRMRQQPSSMGTRAASVLLAQHTALHFV